ncbi:hypothetical protein [Methanococcoides seepicolus]|nr:hypothetical protein [Methanococcoides seepicolus]
MTEVWKHVILKLETHDRLKKESVATGTKMWALVDKYVPELETNK